MARSLSHSLIAMLAVPLAAQAVDHTYPRVSLFYGTAPAIGDSGLQKVRESVLIGLEYSHPVWKGCVSAAVEWRSFRSRNHEVTQFSPRAVDGTTLQDWEAIDPFTGQKMANVVSGGVLRTPDPGQVRTGYAVVDGKPTQTRGYITAHSRYPGFNSSSGVRDGISSDMRWDSVHMAKYNLGGGTSKIAYRQFFKVPLIDELGVQGGLTLSFLTAAEYTSGAIHVLDYRRHYDQNVAVSINLANLGGQGTINSSTTADDPRLDILGRLGNEYFLQDNTDMKIQPGLFVGVRAFVKDNYFFETNLVMLSHTQPIYVPASYTGKEPYVDSVTKTKMVWEFNVGIRF